MAGEVDLISIVSELGRIGLWLQAIGIIIILWVAFEITSLIINRKRMKQIYEIRKDINRIEGKINKLMKKNKI